ncbi:MAG: hypothetical protein ACHQQQ_14865, partial [Bacteroidota bacterium]
MTNYRFFIYQPELAWFFPLINTGQNLPTPIWGSTAFRFDSFNQNISKFTESSSLIAEEIGFQRVFQ